MDRTAGVTRVFQAPALFLAFFYALLAVWTVSTLPIIYLKFRQVGLESHSVYAAIIGFFYLYTWFWALGLFYRIALDAEGRVVLKSLRRTVEVAAKQISGLEGSRFPGRFGFIKVKIPRESG
jgi:hypothetical protein